MKNIFKKINNEPLIHLEGNKYNYIGQLIEKQLHIDAALPYGYLQKMDFRYNTHGSLSSINNASLISDGGITNTDNADVFGEEIYYENSNEINVDNNAANHVEPKPQYNGNISAIRWKSRSSNIDPLKVPEHLYAFKYDALDRMEKANFGSSLPGNINWFDRDFKRFDEIAEYDANGNITHLNRFDNQTENDNLTYTYSGNILKNVDDAVIGGTSGFKDVQNTQDYDYDANGNLNKDLNKGINSIVYNYLDLPATVQNNTEILDYIYDASGQKLTKKVNGINPHDYIEDAEYENGNLQFISTEEGRIRLKDPAASNNTNFVSDYFLRDHLGNIRAIVTDEKVSKKYAATMENVNAAAEEQLFYNLPSTREPLPAGYPVDNTYTPNLMISNLNLAENKTIGPAKVLKVTQGDKIDISTKYYYTQLPSNTNQLPLNDILTQLASVFFISPSNGISIAGSEQTVRQTWANDMFFNNSVLNSYLSSTFNAINTSSPLPPKAFLVYLYYDDDFNFIPEVSGVEHAAQANVLGSLGVLNLIPPKSGYIFIYVCNESPSEVYFDNLNIHHTLGDIREINDYYPYGSLIGSLSSNSLNTMPQNYKFNDQELENALDWKVQNYAARLYDPVIGRWHSIDPLTTSSSSWSPYKFGYCNPARFYDIGGMEEGDGSGDPDSPGDPHYNYYYDQYGFHEEIENGLTENHWIEVSEVSPTINFSPESGGAGFHPISSGHFRVKRETANPASGVSLSWMNNGFSSRPSDPNMSSIGMQTIQQSQGHVNYDAALEIYNRSIPAYDGNDVSNIATQLQIAKNVVNFTPIIASVYSSGKSGFDVIKAYKNAISSYKGQGLTKAAKALTEKPSYFGFDSYASLRKVYSTDASLNKLASTTIKDMIRNGTPTTGAGGRYLKGWVTYTLPNGNAVSFNLDGTLIGFRGIYK